MPAYSRILLPWDSQPQEVVEVDWANPLASGLLIAILPQLPVNLADGVALSAYGTRVVSGGARGMMNTSGGMLLPAPVNASDPSAKYDLSSGTALVVAVQSTETNNGVVFTRGRGSAEPLWAIGLHGGSFDGAFGSWGNSGHLGAFSGGPVPTIPRVVAITADGATARVYIGGAEVASGAYTPGTPDYDTANLRRVLFGLDKLGVNTNTHTFLALLWNRPLSVAEVKEVSDNPWRIFAPRSIWIPVSAGGGGVSGTLATTNANDTSAASGTTTVLGTLARTNASDTSAASGTTTVLGTLATTNASDTSAASGTTTILGTVAATNGDDTAAASGTVGSSGSTGTVAYTNANDTAAAAGTTTVTGTVARSNADDSVSASGWVGAITGTLATTNANDTVSASGIASSGVAGGGGYLPSFRRKTRKEIHAERVRLGILPEQIRKAAKKVVEKAAEQGDPQEVYEDNTEKYRAMFLREIGATKWAPDYARAIRIQLELMERDAEDALLLM